MGKECLGCDRRTIGCHSTCKDFDEPKRLEGYKGYGKRCDILGPFHDYLHAKVTQMIRTKNHSRF